MNNQADPMNKQKRILIMLTLVLIAVVSWLKVADKAVWAAVIPVACVSGLVIAAMFEKPAEESSLTSWLGPPEKNPPSSDWSKTLYERATQMHIDTDKGMF
jgi:hypothetical protein